MLEKFIVKGQPTVNEEGEEVVKKTFFQKFWNLDVNIVACGLLTADYRYWWVLVGIEFLALSGGGKK